MNILGKASDKAFWSELKNKDEYKFLINAVLRDYEECCLGEIETTKFSKFRLFKEKGDRTAYQKTFFARQHRLYAMTFMCLLYPENESYNELLQDTIWEICDQYVWALPAHIDNIEINNNSELDLDSTTLSMALAVIKVLLGDTFHPLINSRIDAEIDRRLVKPFFEKRWHWEYRANNWTAVCSGATGCAIMLNRPELFELARDRLNENMADYLRSYKDDGVCVEGAGYWSYGFGYFMEYAIMQKEFTKGAFDLTKSEKVRSISTFLQKLFLDKDVIVNYGDCGVGTSVSVPGGFMFGLKRLYSEVQLPPEKALSYQVHYFPFMLRAFTDFDVSYVSEDISTSAEYYMADQGWFVKRCEKYGFAGRGGSNGESHNHNDVGSFILSIDNNQVLIDMGGRPYTRQYFEHDTRYTFLETSSRGHNVPIINGEYQKNIRGAGSKTSFENGVFSVDFGDVYGINGLKLRRDYSFGNTSITITDNYSANVAINSFKERFVSNIKPTMFENEVVIGKAHIKLENGYTASYEKDVHAVDCDVNGNIAKGIDIYLTTIEQVSPNGKASITIEIE